MALNLTGRALQGSVVVASKQIASNEFGPVPLRSQAPVVLSSPIKRRYVPIKCQAAAVALEATPVPSINSALIKSRTLATAPSGQPAHSAYGCPCVGRPEPLGASNVPGSTAVNFAVVSQDAAAVSLVLFSEDDLYYGRPTHEIPLHPELNRTGTVWHILLPSVDSRLLYGFRVQGLHQEAETTAAGMRFDGSQVLLDPYARAIISRRRYGELGPELDYASPDVLGLAPTWPQAACALPPPAGREFDWQGDRPLNLPMEDLVIYEMHVRGYTAHPSSGVVARGTYAGMVERLDYLQGLGVNAVELLPVCEFNELEYYTQIPGTDKFRHNFWGYSTVGFFAPMSRYSWAVAQGRPGCEVADEFKTLVRECHRRGIEVILDVVFNHTAEGNEMGPTLSFRGLDNRVYYMLAPGGEYYNYSGCGNTFNCNQPTVRQFILDCLKFWVTEYHVDGFRFDLASILTRAPSAWHPQEVGTDGTRTAPLSGGAIIDERGIMTDGAGVPTGTPLPDPPLIEMISEDPVLRNTKMIAEAWDCDGLNQVGAFPHYGGRWAEWNGKFRDVVRQFIKGTDGPWAGDFASALCGSPNMYASHHANENDWWGLNGGRQWKGGRGPSHSINFITAHDGFTLADLVSYNNKHNEANGENNRDGESHNLSWNCGEEGPSANDGVNRLRQRQMRNFACALLLSHGVPMLTMGDEYGHSKRGNNNTYCHDSDLNYINWAQVASDEDGFARFTRLLVKFRRATRALRRTTYITDAEIQWHGEVPNKPDWTETSRLVAYTLKEQDGSGLYVAFNTGHTPKLLQLPHWPGHCWQPLVDTSKAAPYDFLEPDAELSEAEVAGARLAMSQWLADRTCPLLPWSCVVLRSVPDDGSISVAAQRAMRAVRRSSSPTAFGSSSGARVFASSVLRQAPARPATPPARPPPAAAATPPPPPPPARVATPPPAAAAPAPMAFKPAPVAATPPPPPPPPPAPAAAPAAAAPLPAVPAASAEDLAADAELQKLLEENAKLRQRLGLRPLV